MLHDNIADHRCLLFAGNRMIKVLLEGKVSKNEVLNREGSFYSKVADPLLLPGVSTL